MPAARLKFKELCELIVEAEDRALKPPGTVGAYLAQNDGQARKFCCSIDAIKQEVGVEDLDSHRPQAGEDAQRGKANGTIPRSHFRRAWPADPPGRIGPAVRRDAERTLDAAREGHVAQEGDFRVGIGRQTGRPPPFARVSAARGPSRGVHDPALGPPRAASTHGRGDGRRRRPAGEPGQPKAMQEAAASHAEPRNRPAPLLGGGNKPPGEGCSRQRS